MRHLLVVIVLLLASCVDSASEPEPESPAEPEMQTPPDMTEPEDESTPTPESPDAVIARWQQCMTFSDFQSANVASAWANTATTTTNQKCTSCHLNGGWGFMATTNAQQMFDVLKTDKYYLLQFITLAPQGAQSGTWQVIFNEQAIPAAGSGQVPHAEHPRFTATAGMNAARAFHQLTQARCSTPI